MEVWKVSTPRAVGWTCLILLGNDEDLVSASIARVPWREVPRGAQAAGARVGRERGLCAAAGGLARPTANRCVYLPRSPLENAGQDSGRMLVLYFRRSLAVPPEAHVNFLPIERVGHATVSL